MFVSVFLLYNRAALMWTWLDPEVFRRESHPEQGAPGWSSSESVTSSRSCWCVSGSERSEQSLINTDLWTSWSRETGHRCKQSQSAVAVLNMSWCFLLTAENIDLYTELTYTNTMWRIFTALVENWCSDFSTVCVCLSILVTWPCFPWILLCQQVSMFGSL